MSNHDRQHPAAKPGSGPIRTLLVDDSTKWLTPLCAFLANEPAGAIVRIAHDGLEALGRIESLRPALVLLDVRMPRVGGLEAASLIRTRFPEMRILMMSTDDDSMTRESCFAHGAHAFVPKSEAGTELLPAIFGLFGGGEAVAQPEPVLA